MSLIAATWLLAGVLALVSLQTLAAPHLWVSLRRSKLAGAVLGLAAIAMLGWHLGNLPQPDLAGFPRLPVLAIFVLGGLAAFIWLPDLLPIRALGCLMMFLARAVLDAGWMQLPASALNAWVCYLLLVIPGLWWATSPGAFVRHTDALLAHKTLRLSVGALLFLATVATTVRALTLN